MIHGEPDALSIQTLVEAEDAQGHDEGAVEEHGSIWDQRMSISVPLRDLEQ